MAWKVVAVAGLVLLVHAVPADANPPVTRDTVAWTLNQARVVSPGETVVVPPDPEAGFPGGTLTTGYTIEARAHARSGGLVPSGTFRLEITAFRPSADLPGQKAGSWHVQGKWTLVDERAAPASLKARHNPYLVHGRIDASLPFNPAADPGRFEAKAWLPMAPAAGQWARGGNGTLGLDLQRGGVLTVPVALGPSLSGRRAP